MAVFTAVDNGTHLPHNHLTAIPGGQFVRVVDTGKNIGITSLKEGGTPTRYIKIFTDEMGNLITTYPVKGQ